MPTAEDYAGIAGAAATTAVAAADSLTGAASTLASVASTLAVTQANIEANSLAIATAAGAAGAATATTQAGIATTQAGIATTQAGLATTNGAAQVALAAAQVTLATTQAGNAATSATTAVAAAATSIAPANASIAGVLPLDRNMISVVGWTADTVMNGANGAPTSTGGSGKSLSGYIMVEPSTTYTTVAQLSGTNPTIYGFSDMLGTGTGTISAGGISAGGTFTTGASTTFIRIAVTTSTIAVLDIYKGNNTRKIARDFTFLEKNGAVDLIGEISTPSRIAMATKASLLNRSTIKTTGTWSNNTGVFTDSATSLYPSAITDLFPVSTIDGVATTFDSQNNGARHLTFYDRFGVAVCPDISLFTATFTAGSPNFTISAFTGISGILFQPKGSPAACAPAMVGHALYDVTNSGAATVIPARTVIKTVPTDPYSTTGTYTMCDASGSPVNAASSATISVSGNLLAGVPLVPPKGYGITFAKYYYMAFAYNLCLDDWELYNFNFANTAEQRAGTAPLTAVKYQANPHCLALGPGEAPTDRPLFGKKIGILGNSVGQDEMWTKYLAWETRCNIRLRGAVAGMQVQDFLSGAASFAGNWNFITGNVSSVYTSADFVGLDYCIIPYVGGNDIGYNSGGVLTSLSTRQPHPMGVYGDTAPVCAFNVTTTAASSTITVNSLSSGLVIAVGAQFPSTAPAGLAGKFILAYGTSGTTGTGTTGTYAIGNTAGGAANGTGVTATTSNTIVGTFYGSLSWLCETLFAWNPTMIPILTTGLQRTDCGSANGGVTSGTYDRVNFGNPVNTLGLRSSDYADAVINFGKKARVIVYDLFYNGPFGKANNAADFSDGLHPTPTISAPVGSRKLAAAIAGLANRQFAA
jgi:hypothetical protein